MKKLTIAGIAALVLIAVAAGGWFYVHQRARSEVEAAFAGLRTGSTTATYGAVALDPFRMALTISDIAIADGSGTSGRIAKVSAAGIDLMSKTFAAKSVAADGVVVTMPAAPKPDTAKSSERAAPTTVKLEQVTATNVRVGASAAPAAGAATARLAAVLEPLQIDLVSVPKLEVEMSSGGDVVRMVYERAEARDIRDGKVGRIAMAGGSLTSAGGTSTAGSIGGISGTFGPADVSDVDLISLVGPANPKRTVVDGFTRLHGPMKLGPMKVSTPEGINIAIEAVTSGAFDAAPTFSMARYQERFATVSVGGRQPTPAEAAQMMEALADFYNEIRIDKVEILGLVADGSSPKSGARPVEGSMALLRLQGLKNGRLDEYAIEGVKLKGPAGPIELGRVALKGLAIGELMRAMSKVAGRPGQPPADFAASMIGMMSGLELAGIDVPDPNAKTTTRIGELAATWGSPVNGLPTLATLKGNVDLPLDPTQSSHAALKQRGYTALPVTFDIEAGWKEAEQVLTVTPRRVEFKGLGSIAGTVVLGNVPRSAIGLDTAKLLAAMPDFEIVKLDLDIVDLGALQASEAERAAVSMQLAASQAKLAAAGQKAENFAALSQAIEQFSGSTGKTLSLRFTPKAKMAVADALVALNSEVGFASLLDAADLSATVK